jgi:hypothetical protein
MKFQAIASLVIAGFCVGSLLCSVSFVLSTSTKLGTETKDIYQENFENFKKQKLLTAETSTTSVQKAESLFFVWENNTLKKIKKPNTLEETKNQKYFISTNEKLSLKDGILTLSKNQKTVWQSPKNWWVDSYDIADVDGDEKNDLAMSVWKSGNFGTSQPFWIKQNDPEVKNHFFVFSFLKNKIVPLWQSSNLPVPNCEFFITNLDNDKTPELVVVEGTYSRQKCVGDHLAVWKWNGWGFSNEYRSESGVFQKLKLVESKGKKIIAVN